MKLYVVQNTAGKFFRARGQRGWKDQWQEKLEDAKFYSNFTTAKTQCTIWYNANPKLGCPHVLEFNLDPTKATAIDMTAHAMASAAKKAKEEAKQQEQRRIHDNLRSLEQAKKLISVLTPEQKKQLGM